jgi:integrase
MSARRVPVKNNPGVYKRGGRYSYTYSDHLGRQRYGSAATLAEARKLKASKTTDVARGEFRETSKLTVTDYARKWISSYGGRTRRGITADTLADYRKELGLDADGELTGGGFLAFAGRMRMVDVTPGEIIEYAASLAGRGLARNTVRLALAPVKAMFATAVEDTTLRWNPAAVRVNVGPVDDDEDGAEAKALSRPQLNGLLDELPARWLPFFELLAEYGLRCGEAIELRWKDVEVPDHAVIDDGQRVGGFLHVRRRFYRGRVSSPKSGSMRKLKMSVEMARALDRLRGDPDGLVFTADKGGRIGASNLMSRVLKPAAVRAGVGEWVKTDRGERAESWVGFHTFRHTCATLAIIEEGWSLEQVQVFLGHSSRMTTDRYYAHLTSKDAPVPSPIRGGEGGQRVARRRVEKGGERAVAAVGESAG